MKQQLREGGTVTDAGNRQGRVTFIDADNAEIDGDPRLAGEALAFKAEPVSIQRASVTP